MGLFFLLSLLSGNYVAPVDDKPVTGQAQQTLLVYMVGSDLESGGGCGTSDLREMVSGKADDKTNIIVMTGGAKRWKMRDSEGKVMQNGMRYQLKNSKFVPLGMAPDANMGKVSTLQNFIEWGIATYPARNVHLVCWDHGGGFPLGYGWDEVYQSHLQSRDLQEALKKAYATTKKKLGIIGYDACLLGSVEMALMVQPYAEVMVASEESEPGHGWNYTPIVAAMTTKPDISNLELGKVICDGFYEQSHDSGTLRNCTLTVVDLSKMDPVRRELDVFAGLLPSMEFNKLSAAVKKAPHFGGSTSDEDGMAITSLQSILQGIRKMPGNNAEVFLRVLNDAIYYRVAGDPQPQGEAGGLSIYFPLTRNNSYMPYYQNQPIMPAYVQALKKLSDKRLLDSLPISLQPTLNLVKGGKQLGPGEDNVIELSLSADELAQETLEFRTDHAPDFAEARLVLIKRASEDDPSARDELVTDIPVRIEKQEDGSCKMLARMDKVICVLNSDANNENGNPVETTTLYSQYSVENGVVSVICPVQWQGIRADLTASGPEDAADLDIDLLWLEPIVSQNLGPATKDTETLRDRAVIVPYRQFYRDEDNSTQWELDNAKAATVWNPFTLKRVPLPAGDYTLQLEVADFSQNSTKSPLIHLLVK